MVAQLQSPNSTHFKLAYVNHTAQLNILFWHLEGSIVSVGSQKRNMFISQTKFTAIESLLRGGWRHMCKRHSACRKWNGIVVVLAVEFTNPTSACVKLSVHSAVTLDLLSWQVKFKTPTLQASPISLRWRNRIEWDTFEQLNLKHWRYIWVECDVLDNLNNLWFWKIHLSDHVGQNFYWECIYLKMCIWAQVYWMLILHFNIVLLQ